MGETLTEIRSHFWIIKCRPAVKKDISSKCVTCKKLQGRAYSSSPTPFLHSFRVSDDLAFSKVGVDFAGPLYVKNISPKERCTSVTLLYLLVQAQGLFISSLSPDLSAKSFLRKKKKGKDLRVPLRRPFMVVARSR